MERGFYDEETTLFDSDGVIVNIDLEFISGADCSKR